MRDPVYYRRLSELAMYFLRLGLTAFGGPAAHIAMMEEDCVRRRQWITRERFLDVLGAANLIPGPTSTELAMHIGFARAGMAGLVVAGVCFIVPAAVLVGLLAAAYVRLGTLPAIEEVLRFVKPVVVVVVGAAVITLAQSALRRPGAMILAAAVTGLVIAGMNEALALVIGGITSMIVRWRPTSALTIVLLPDLFAYFLKAGSTTFGSGYVLFAILRADLVDRAGWLSEAQLLDAIAVGQVTPGPVFTAATFIGYVLAGPGGAAVATVGMFLPAFIFAALSARFLAWLAGSAVARAFLDGVTAAAVALIGVVVVGLAPHAIVDVSTGAIAIAAALAIGWFRVNAAWVILAAVAMGFAARLL